jgi:tetratricopeptide (TPR) repeat protein
MAGKIAWKALGTACLAAACLTTGGCRETVGDLDARDRSLPFVRKAEARRVQGDVDGAVAAYQEALLRNPEAARAHLDLALLMHDHKRDPIGAIYHYRRYLELRPDTEKRRMIESRVRLATQAFSATASEAEREAIRQADNLARENAELKTELSAARKELARLKEQRDARGGTAVGGVIAPRTYRVQRGDTLAGIAQAVYGDAARWTQIYEANRDKIADGNRLPVGAILTIP